MEDIVVLLALFLQAEIKGLTLKEKHGWVN